MEQELVFKALADEHRRTLLDALFKEDGQTLSELCSYLPMTRYGVMKHLGILEEAGLITSEKVGREKHHYLNAVPLQQVYERWVSKYTRPWAQSLVNLKTHVEGRQMASKHIQQIFIRATPQVVWNALTEAEHTPHYYFGSAVVSDWEVGSEYEYPQPDGDTFVAGEILESIPPERLVMTFKPVFQHPDRPRDTIPTTRITWALQAEDSLCKLTLTHEEIDLNAPETQDLIEGWSRILSGLKTYLETGKAL